MSTCPLKIKQQPNGVFTWSCPIEVEYHRNSMRPGLYACIGIAVFLLISFLIFGLAFSATDPHESYEMGEDFVKSGYGRSSVYFDLKKVKTIVLGGKYIELWGKTKHMRIYIPEEDFDFVKGYIQGRVPMECVIRFM